MVLDKYNTFEMDFSTDARYTGRRDFKEQERVTMITTEDKMIAPTVSTSITSSTSISAGGNTPTTSHPVANMDETDWTTMLMEMRILSA